MHFLCILRTVPLPQHSTNTPRRPLLCPLRSHTHLPTSTHTHTHHVRIVGAAYNSATAFEQQTDKFAYKKPFNSLRLVSGGGSASTTILQYINRELKQQGVSRLVPLTLTHFVKDWAHEQLAAAGVGVLMQPNAIDKLREAKRQKEEALAQGVKAVAFDGGDATKALPTTAAAHAPQAPAGSTRQRRRAKPWPTAAANMAPTAAEQQPPPAASTRQRRRAKPPRGTGSQL